MQSSNTGYWNEKTHKLVNKKGAIGSMYSLTYIKTLRGLDLIDLRCGGWTCHKLQNECQPWQNILAAAKSEHFISQIAATLSDLICASVWQLREAK